MIVVWWMIMTRAFRWMVVWKVFGMELVDARN